MAKGRSWTEAEEKILRNMYNDYDVTVYDIADELNRTVYAITSRAYKLRLRKNPHHNYTFRHSDPPKILYRSGECFGKEFTVRCIDNCEKWYSCLDLWIENIIKPHIKNQKSIIFDDMAPWDQSNTRE